MHGVRVSGLDKIYIIPASTQQSKRRGKLEATSRSEYQAVGIVNEREGRAVKLENEIFFMFAPRAFS